MNEARRLYDTLGADTFERLVSAFYRRVAIDPLLRPLYPEDDLAGAERRLRLFLEQYFGGPATYAQERGHPRLRMRHMPFRIGRPERDAWMTAMRGAIDEAGVSEPERTTMLAYFENTATFMINDPLGGLLDDTADRRTG
jgi:hemoglobin